MAISEHWTSLSWNSFVALRSYHQVVLVRLLHFLCGVSKIFIMCTISFQLNRISSIILLTSHTVLQGCSTVLHNHPLPLLLWVSPHRQHTSLPLRLYLMCIIYKHTEQHTSPSTTNCRTSLVTSLHSRNWSFTLTLFLPFNQAIKVSFEAF